MRTVLCVCINNTCRSPMMERMLRHMLENEPGINIDDVHIDSAGLYESAAGQPMTDFAAKELGQRGIDASGHVARYIGTLNLDDYDLIVTVGNEEATAIQALPEYSYKAPILILGGGILNPWQQGEDAYRICAFDIERCLENLLKTSLLRKQ